MRLSPAFLISISMLMASCSTTSNAPRRTPVPGDADYPTEARSDRHAQKVAAVRSGHYELAMIGDSITHSVGEMPGSIYDSLKEVWARYYAPRKAINLGYSGFRTENILWNLMNGELDFQESPKVAVLLLGTNNTADRNFKNVHTAEQILDGTRAIVKLIRERHPTTKILILRIFPRGGDWQPGYAARVFHGSEQCLATVNQAGLLTRSLADNRNVFWLDVNSVFLRPDGRINTDLMPDLLHPNQAGADAWARAILPTVDRLLGRNTPPSTAK